MKKLIASLLVLLLLVGCSSVNTEKETSTIKVGLTGSDNKTWEYIKSVVADEGIELELVYFDSYPLPNRALADGDIQVNAFQHHIYLEQEIAEFGYDLTVIGETVFAPLAIYSNKITDISQAQDGDIVAIPDDATNGGRALKLLEAQGLIEVDPEAGLLPTLNDITSYNVAITIKEMTATTIPSILADVSFAALNSGVASNAGLVIENAIAVEEATAGENPYINVIVVRTEDKDNEDYLRLVEVYHTDEVKKIIADESNGTSVPAWD